MKKTKKAINYVLVGIVVILIMVRLVIELYFSGTFLEGEWLIRKVLYLIAFANIIVGIWLAKEGTTYLLRKRR